MNKQLISLQVKHTNIAGSGNESIKAKHWLKKILQKKNSRSFADDENPSGNGSSSSVPPIEISQSASLQNKQNQKDNENRISYGTIANSIPQTSESDKSEPFLNYSTLQKNQEHDAKEKQKHSILEPKTPPKKRKIFNRIRDDHKLMVQNEEILTFEERDGSIGYNASMMSDFPDFNYALFDLVSI